MSSITYDFRDERFLVTGATSGLGRQIAIDLVHAGGCVLAIGRRKDALQDLVKTAGQGIVPAACDVNDAQAVEQILGDFVAAYGKLKGLVHAAGMSPLTVLKGWSDEQARAAMDVNFWAGMQLVQLTHKRRYSEDGASFVLLSSIAAKVGLKGAFVYSASKAAMSAAVRSFAKELPRKQRINTVCAGRVPTPMTAPYEDNHAVIDRHLLGLGTIRDVSDAALYLLNDSARWVTGIDFVVDGGYLANC